jgi:soluble lytic murein transglycosylase-like protein
MVKNLYLIGLCLLHMVAVALPVWAGESIVLRTGFRLAADRHEVEGEVFRIYSGDGVTEMPASLVARVEQVESPAAPVQPAAEASVKEATPVTPLAPPAPPANQTPLELAQSAAHKYSLPDAFVAGVMRTESGFNAGAVSPKGAIGLMQLMPQTARDLGVDPTKPAENADAGTRYLRDLLARYEDRPDQVVLALAAYNAGPAAVDKYHGVPPFRETREYILRVLKAWNPPLVAK